MGTPPWYLSARTRRDKHDGRGGQPGVAALDIKEFLGPEIGAEAGLGHDVIGEFKAELGRSHAVAAVGDVRKRPPWMMAGLFSSVWTRFGSIASFSSAAIAPAAPICPAVTGAPS